MTSGKLRLTRNMNHHLEHMVHTHALTVPEMFLHMIQLSDSFSNGLKKNCEILNV